MAPGEPTNFGNMYTSTTSTTTSTDTTTTSVWADGTSSAVVENWRLNFQNEYLMYQYPTVDDSDCCTNPVMSEEERKAAEEKEKAAEQKAENLLKEIVHRVVFNKYKKKGYIEVEGESGKVYRIWKDRQIEVFERTRRKGKKTERKLLHTICIESKEKIPSTDTVISKVLLARNDENRLNKIGRRFDPKDSLTIDVEDDVADGLIMGDRINEIPGEEVARRFAEAFGAQVESPNRQPESQQASRHDVERQMSDSDTGLRHRSAANNACMTREDFEQSLRMMRAAAVPPQHIHTLINQSPLLFARGRFSITRRPVSLTVDIELNVVVSGRVYTSHYLLRLSDLRRSRDDLLDCIVERMVRGTEQQIIENNQELRRAWVEYNGRYGNCEWCAWDIDTSAIEELRRSCGVHSHTAVEYNRA